MFSAIKGLISKQDIDLESFLSNIDLSTIAAKSSESLKTVFSEIDDHTKSEIRQWISSVKAIKNDVSLTDSEKESKLGEIKTNETVLKTLKSVMDVLVNKVPIENKSLLKTGLTGIGLAASVLNFEVSGIALLVLHKALPKFIMTSKFDDLALIIENELSSN